MKTIRLVKPYQFKLQDEPVPNSQDEEVLLRIKAVGVCGSDIHLYKGVSYDQKENIDPLVLGHEFSGLVEAVGASVSDVKPGDRVAVEAGIHCGKCEWCLRGYTNLCPHMRFCGTPPMDGALRQYMSWPAHLVYPMPDSMSFDDGVMAEIYGIAQHSVALANMRPGMTAAVLGSGSIGLAMVQLLYKTRGVTALFATDLLDYRLETAQKMGATVTLNAGNSDIIDRIMQATGGRGVDVVFECAGAEETCYQSVEIAARGGKVIFIGIPEDNRTPFSAAAARRKGLTIRFDRRSLFTYENVIEMIAGGLLDTKTPVTHHFSLEETPQAYDLVSGYKDGVIKAIIHP
ncbi:alcohol dehydrogenase catalytic domain-containing protein [candidate division KSB1 bacterium]|nr:alcohol dehydrogenase catalytic domain-containing protein [candidate division KSB1 bacterium]